MKTIQNTLTTLRNTYHAIKLLNNPELTKTLYNELNKKYQNNISLQNSFLKEKIEKLGKNDLFVHKHYMIQVVG